MININHNNIIQRIITYCKRNLLAIESKINYIKNIIKVNLDNDEILQHFYEFIYDHIKSITVKQAYNLKQYIYSRLKYCLLKLKRDSLKGLKIKNSNQYCEIINWESNTFDVIEQEHIFNDKLDFNKDIHYPSQLNTIIRKEKKNRLEALTGDIVESIYNHYFHNNPQHYWIFVYCYRLKLIDRDYLVHYKQKQERKYVVLNSKTTLAEIAESYKKSTTHILDIKNQILTYIKYKFQHRLFWLYETYSWNFRNQYY